MDHMNVLDKFEFCCGYLKPLGSPWIPRSRSSEVIERKRVCDFLLVRHSNLGPILYYFGDIADFFVLLNDTATISR